MFHSHHHKQLVQRKHFALKRDLGLFSTTMAGIGIIVGAGIYALIGKAAGLAGNSLWLSFVISAFVAAFTGLSYAELSSRFPKDAGEYVYAQKAFGKKIAFLTGYLVIAAGIISAAAVALGFSGYFAALFKTSIALPIIAIAALAVFAFINFYGVKQSAGLNIFLTLAEVAGLVIVIFLGLRVFGSVDYLAMPQGMGGVFSAAALIFFAFLGFESVVKLSEETKNPTKTIPRALILALVISTILYILVGIAAVSAVGWETLSTSKAPLADVAGALFGSNTYTILAIIALLSTANTVLIILLATSRILYGMAANKSLPGALAAIHPSRRTPWAAILLTFILAALFVLPGNIGLVAEATNFAVFISFIIVNAALIYLRYKEPVKTGFKVPLNIGKFPILPALGIVTSIFLLLNLSVMVILAGIALTVVGGVMCEVMCRYHSH